MAKCRPIRLRGAAEEFFRHLCVWAILGGAVLVPFLVAKAQSAAHACNELSAPIEAYNRAAATVSHWMSEERVTGWSEGSFVRIRVPASQWAQMSLEDRDATRSYLACILTRAANGKPFVILDDAGHMIEHDTCSGEVTSDD